MNETQRTITEIEARHAEILEKLDDLDSKILSTLEEWSHSKETSLAQHRHAGTDDSSKDSA